MDREMNVFVLYSRTLDVGAWEEQYRKGLAPDCTPYGYHHAEAHGCRMSYSRPTRPRGVLKLIDKVLRRVLRFDLLHVWNNRRNLFDPQIDVIWTHTEEEHLGIGVLRALFRKPSSPVIAQSVWLMDRWKSFGVLRRMLFRQLLSRMEVLTFLSTLNADAARRRFPNKRIEHVRFGISAESFPITKPRPRLDSERQIRVLSIGHDVHRDWATLCEALGGRSGVTIRALSRNFPRDLIADNISVEYLDQNGIRSAYAWADCVVVPLTDNLHASGITVALEAIALGVPLVITRVGGLEAYLDGEGVCFVEIGDAAGLRAAVLNLSQHDYVARAAKAQQHFERTDATTAHYARQHVALSRELSRA